DPAESLEAEPAAVRSALQSSPPNTVAADKANALAVDEVNGAVVELVQADSQIEAIKVLLEGKRKMFLVTALEGARRAGVEGDELYVEFTPESRHLRDTLAKTDNVKLLRDACKQAVGREL